MCSLLITLIICKKNCPECRSIDSKLNGKNSDWKQKYKCKKCWFCFVKHWRKKDIIRGENIFNNWLNEWYSVRQLSLQTWKSKDILKEYIRKHLDKNDIYQIDLVFDNIHHIMIDWTWIMKDICLIIYYEYVQKKVLRFGFYDWERYEYIKDDLLILRDWFWYDIQSFTIDWSKAIKKAIDVVFPHSKIQRCLTHIQRQIKNNISNNPQSNCWKDLQKLITFANFEHKERFISTFHNWEEKYVIFLKEKSSKWHRYWYTHRKLRASRSHIKNALPYMFHYLHDSNIKRSSNDLEWLNWVLSDQIYNHRGLKKKRLFSFISLWIYNRNLR